MGQERVPRDLVVLLGAAPQTGRGVGQEGNRWDPSRVQRGGPRGSAGTGSHLAAGRRRGRVASLSLPLSPQGVKLLQLLRSPSNFRCFALSSRSEHVC